MRFMTSEIARAVGGEVFGRDVTVDGVTIDSRSAAPGQLFVPIIAERDGHDFISAAVGAGASAYFTSGPIEAATAVRVDDTRAALTGLGHLARSRLTGPVVGITGSVGKTSVKDLLAAVGATTWRTSAAVGSFNNEMGVPITLANVPDGTELVVLEMGARNQGHVAWLCEVGRPTVGLVTVVGEAHLELFGSLDAVAVAKSELVASLPADGFAVLNQDDQRVAAMAEVTGAQVVGYGVTAGDVRAEGIEIGDDLRARFTLVSDWGTAPVRLGVAGRHQVTNALAAAAAALALGAPVAAVVEGLGGARLSAMRMDLVRLASGARLLDDAYNANPTSMRAALDALAAIPAKRRIAVLGTMGELGDGADEAHRRIAEQARELGMTVVAVAEASYGNAADGVDQVADPGAAVARLHDLGLGPEDAVLVKASRSAGLERVVSGLRAITDA